MEEVGDLREKKHLSKGSGVVVDALSEFQVVSKEKLRLLGILLEHQVYFPRPHVLLPHLFI